MLARKGRQSTCIKGATLLASRIIFTAHLAQYQHFSHTNPRHRRIDQVESFASNVPLRKRCWKNRCRLGHKRSTTRLSANTILPSTIVVFTRPVRVCPCQGELVDLLNPALVS